METPSSAHGSESTGRVEFGEVNFQTLSLLQNKIQGMNESMLARFESYLEILGNELPSQIELAEAEQQAAREIYESTDSALWNQASKNAGDHSAIDAEVTKLEDENEGARRKHLASLSDEYTTAVSTVRALQSQLYCVKSLLEDVALGKQTLQYLESRKPKHSQSP